VRETDPSTPIPLKLWLSGTLRGTTDPVNAVVSIALRLSPAGHVEVAEATVDPALFDQIRQARLRS
jgi:hypothetical protein